MELEHRLRCERVPSVTHGRFGKTKFNVNGKNPGDVWGDIKQLTYKSKELVGRDALHTIQKPEKLIERLVKASSNEGDVVLDPFAGVGTCRGRLPPKQQTVYRNRKGGAVCQQRETSFGRGRNRSCWELVRVWHVKSSERSSSWF